MSKLVNASLLTLHARQFLILKYFNVFQAHSWPVFFTIGLQIQNLAEKVLFLLYYLHFHCIDLSTDCYA